MSWTVVLPVALTLCVSACGGTEPEGNMGPWVGDWVQVNFLSIDDHGMWDEDDLSGIGFVMEITETQWTDTDDHGDGCSVTYSYSVSDGNRYSRKPTGVGSRCPFPLEALPSPETGRLEFSGDNRFMIQWFDPIPGDEIVAFKFVRR
ncbi:MAG TPA: hypothetical protein VE173_08050 [Longimicrobiales bacterium]|nr:hypothetical protein [Longimicrobiales bacterium]